VTKDKKLAGAWLIFSKPNAEDGTFWMASSVEPNVFLSTPLDFSCERKE